MSLVCSRAESEGEMTQAEIEKELRALRSELHDLTERAKSRQTEWRRLGLIAKVTSVSASLAGAGFLIANVAVERTGANSPACHDGHRFYPFGHPPIDLRPSVASQPASLRSEMSLELGLKAKGK